MGEAPSTLCAYTCQGLRLIKVFTCQGASLWAAAILLTLFARFLLQYFRASPILNPLEVLALSSFRVTCIVQLICIFEWKIFLCLYTGLEVVERERKQSVL